MSDHILEQFNIHYMNDKILESQTFEPNQLIATPETGEKGFLSLYGGQLLGPLIFANSKYSILNNGATYTGTADKAIKDTNGNNIIDTYATIASLELACDILRSETTEMINNIIGPGTTDAIDTIKEIADWITNDESATQNILDTLTNLQENKTNIDASNILDTNKWKEKLGYITELPDTYTKEESDNLYVPLIGGVKMSGYLVTPKGSKINVYDETGSNSVYERAVLGAPYNSDPNKFYLLGHSHNKDDHSTSYNDNIYVDSGLLYTSGIYQNNNEVIDKSLSNMTEEDITNWKTVLNISSVYTGNYSSQSANTTLSTLRIGYVSNNLYIWNS